MTATSKTPFGPLQTLRERPLPDFRHLRTLKQGYRDYPLNPDAPRNRERLLDARKLDLDGENAYASARVPPYYRPAKGAIKELYIREGVARRLKQVDAKLRKQALRLFIHDAWRPQAIQAYFHDVWFPGELKRRRPELRGKALQDAVEEYWAAPSGEAASPAPHATGGAVDLTIAWVDGPPLWMGSIFDELSPLAYPDHFENLSTAELAFSDEEARANRRLLYWILEGAGFALHPQEWWHFSHGDQMWAKMRGEPAAVYAAAEPD